MMKRLSWLWLAVLGTGWLFDFLFWMKQPGISFALFAMICLLVGLGLALGEGLRPARTTLLLLVPFLPLVIFSFIRTEPLSLFLDYVLVLSLMALMGMSFLGGRWWAYGPVDYLLGTILLAGSALGRAPLFWRKNRPAEAGTDPQTRGGPSAVRRSVPVLRGLLLAAPVVILFALLLSSADPIFSQGLSNILSIFKLYRLPEYILRLALIMIVAYLLAGIYLHAFTRSQDEKLGASRASWLPPFLGLTEAGVVLGSVNLLFAAFVAVQFRYFFGGHANINLQGYTYAEYARRGFGELVAVAFFSLLLFLGLSAVTRHSGPRQRWIFSSLGAVLVLLLAVILASAFQRLFLYEQAYGFTRLRTYPHVFMIWTGILLGVVFILDLVDRLRYFMLAFLVVSLGFGLSLNGMNVDGFIARQNLLRAQTSQVMEPQDSPRSQTVQVLDIQYLKSLSEDAVPVMMDTFLAGQLPAGSQSDLGAVLACQATLLSEKAGNGSWQSFNLARSLAAESLKSHQDVLRAYTTYRDENGRWMVMTSSGTQSCIEGAPLR